MADKKISKSDIINEATLHEILLNMDARLKHIEDITADNRAVIIKLVKQSNEIVHFLKQIEITQVSSGEFEDSPLPPIDFKEKIDSIKSEKLKALLDEFMEKRESLKELEEELEKHSDKLTPGIIGES